MSSRQKGPAWLPGGRWWISGSQVVRGGLGAESEHPPCIGRAFVYQGDLPGEVLPVVHDGLRHRSGLVVIPDDDEEEYEDIEQEREQLLQAIVDLDVAFEKGQIEPDAYTAQRAELKTALAEIWE